MELTQTFETVTRSNIEKPVLQEVTEEQESEDGVEQPDSEKTEIKEQEEEERVLTDQIIDDNDEENADDHKPGNISSNDFSEHMDLTIVDYKRLTIMDHFLKFLEVMDLIMVNYLLLWI